MAKLTRVTDWLVKWNSMLTGSVERLLHDKLLDTVSVKDFGAKGDGVTDDSSAFKSALNSGASLVRVPAGVYIITSKLVLPRGVSLYGEGVDYWDTYRPDPTRLLKSWSKGTHLVFSGTGGKSDTFTNISNERPVKTVGSVVCGFTKFTNEDAVGITPATPKPMSIAVQMSASSQLRNLRIMVSKSGISGYNDASSTTLADNWDIGLHLFDSSDAVVDNVQVVGYWRVKGALLTENDGSISMRGNPEKTHLNNFYVQSGIAIRNCPQIDVVSNTTDSVTFKFVPSMRITAFGSFRIAGQASAYSFTGATNDGTNVTLSGVTPAITGTLGVIRFTSMGNNFSGTVFENTVATTLDHTSGASSETFGLPTSFALEVDGFPVRNLRFDKFKAQTTFDKGNLLLGDCRDIKMTSSEFENGIAVAYSLEQTQGYTGNLRFFASDLQSGLNTTAFTPRDAFIDNRQIKTDFTDGSFILKNWRPTNTSIQWSTGVDAIKMRELSTEGSVGGFYMNYLDGTRFADFNGATKEIQVTGGNVSFKYTDATNVMSWFGGSGNISIKGNMSPMVHNSKSLGTQTLSYSKVFSVGGVDTTSDGRRKIASDLTQVEVALGLKLAISYMTYKWTDGSDDSRLHIGSVAQYVIQCFEEFGLNHEDYNVVTFYPACYVDGKEQESAYSINYGELNSLCIAALAHKISTL